MAPASFTGGSPLAYVLFASVCLLTLAGCDDPVDPPPPVAAVSVSGAPTSFVVVGASVPLQATAQADNGAVVQTRFTWRSSNTEIATVSSAGVVTARAAGLVWISAASGSAADSVQLDVRESGTVGATGGTLTFLGGAVRMQFPAGSSTTQVVVRPAIGTPPHLRIVGGTVVEITPGALGASSSVRLTLHYHGDSVPNRVPESLLRIYRLTDAGWQVVAGSTSNQDANEVSAGIVAGGIYAVIGAIVTSTTVMGNLIGGALHVGAKGRFVAVLTGDPAFIYTMQPQWTSSDATIATVDANGMVTGVAPGTVNITATADGVSASTQLIILPRPVADWTRAAEWTSSRGNSANTGYADVTLDPGAFGPGRTEIFYEALAMPPVVTSNGKVFGTLNGSAPGTTGRFIFARDGNTGAALWTKELTSTSGVSAAAFANGRLWVPITTSQAIPSVLLSFDEAGTELSRVNYSTASVHTIAADSGLYLGGADVHRFNTRSATLSYTISGTASSGFVGIRDGVLYVNGNPAGVRKISAYDAATGAPLYVITDGRIPAATPVITSAGHIVFGSGKLLAVSLSTRQVAWEVTGSFVGTPVVANGVIYIVNGSGVDARSESTGVLLWRWVPPTPTAYILDPLLITNNLLFVGASTAIYEIPTATYAIDVNARRHVWAYPAVGRMSLSPEGMLYIASTESARKLSAVRMR